MHLLYWYYSIITFFSGIFFPYVIRIIHFFFFGGWVLLSVCWGTLCCGSSRIITGKVHDEEGSRREFLFISSIWGGFAKSDSQQIHIFFPNVNNTLTRVISIWFSPIVRRVQCYSIPVAFSSSGNEYKNSTASSSFFRNLKRNAKLHKTKYISVLHD